MEKGACQTSNINEYDDEKEDEPQQAALDEGDIQLLKSYGQGPYSAAIKARPDVEDFIVSAPAW